MEKRSRGRPSTGKERRALALDIDAKVLDRLDGCVSLMRRHRWSKTGIVERSLTEFFDFLEARSGVQIPLGPVVQDSAPPPSPPPPHPLMRK